MRLVVAFLVVLSGLYMGAGPALAAARDDVMANLTRCNSFTENRDWLNCFYGAAQPMRSELGLPPAPQSQTDLVKNARLAPPPMEKESSGGGFLGIGNVFGSDTTFTQGGVMRLSDFSFGKDGIFTATLSDGEVWRQSPYDNLRAKWKGVPASYEVVVTADMMGSHTMHVRGDQNYRVMRIK